MNYFREIKNEYKNESIVQEKVETEKDYLPKEKNFDYRKYKILFCFI